MGHIITLIRWVKSGILKITGYGWARDKCGEATITVYPSFVYHFKLNRPSKKELGD